MSEIKNDFVYKKFVQIVAEVFSTMVGVEVEARPVTKAERQTIRNEIAGMMMLSGDQNAVISFSMTYNSAAFIVSYMTGLDSSELTPGDVYDGVAELVNIIAGKGKAMLQGTEYYYKISSPFTIVGQELFMNYKNKSVQFGSLFSSCDMEMYLELAYL